jgi:hypothetical protein
MANVMHKLAIRPPDTKPAPKVMSGPTLPAGRAKLGPRAIFTPHIGLKLGT